MTTRNRTTITTRCRAGAAACITALCAITLAAAVPLWAQVSTTFDADLEGWLVTGDNSTVWKSTGGNPGGCLDVNDLATGQFNYAIAPARYLGDWSLATTADSLSVDYRFDNISGSAIYAPAFMISGPGGSASSEAIYPPELAWTTFAVALDPALWTIESGTWASILDNVTSLRVGGEFVDGQEELWIDNVILSLDPYWIYSPCVLDDFNDGSSGDWSFVDCSSSNPGSGGNGGGYVRIADATGTSYAFAPASFLGDWSSLDSSGVVTIDIRLLSFSGTVVGSSEFIRLTGPGGVAHFPLDALDVPTNPLEWKTVAIPLDGALWTVDSGSWAALLTEIHECRIEIEFVDGTEVVGFDNFGRLAAGCEVADGNVVVHDDTVSIGQQVSMPEIYNCAVNPADGELYGVLRGSSAGDGLWGVTGSQARTRLQAYSNPAHLIFDSDGDAYVSEDYGGNIFRLEWGGSSSTWVSGLHTDDDDPFGFTVAPPGFDGPAVNAGDFLVTDRGSGSPAEVWVFFPDVPEGEQFLASTTGMTVFDLAAGSTGVVYGADAADGDNLVVLAPDGTITSLAFSENLGAPLSVVYHPGSGDLFVATELTTTYAVYRVDPADGTVSLVADGFDLLAPCSLELAGDSLWVTDSGWGRVYELVLTMFSDGFESGDTSAWTAAVGGS